MEIKSYIMDIAEAAKKASKLLGKTKTEVKDSALLKIAEKLIENKDKILNANAIDLKAGEERGLSKGLLDRLMLNEDRISSMAQGLREVAALKDPVGEVTGMWKGAQDIMIGQMRVPMGVIGIIYEARPNVTVDAAALCIKTGNAVILRGGKEAINTNIAVSKIIRESALEGGLPDNSVQLVETTDREAVNIMLKLNGYIDVIIPRGGADLINTVVRNSSVPVIETGVGNCHEYVDSHADLNMALDILVNGKTQRIGVCNALESLLVHREVAEKFLPMAGERLTEYGVEIRGCERTLEILKNAKPAAKEDWGKEFLDLIISVKIVDSFDEAIEHIDRYGTKHSEVIVTNDYQTARRFQNEVDAAAVYVNASTRFTDGHQFGFGAEIGISTQKLHARGPMGLKELTTTKYIIMGEGQTRK